MKRMQPRKLRLLDALILVCFGFFAVGIAISTDRDHERSMVFQPKELSPGSRLPIWLRLWRPNVIRIQDDAVAVLCIFGTGLAISMFRPRRETPPCVRLPVGYITSLLIVLVFIANLSNYIEASRTGTIEPPGPYNMVRRICGISLNLSHLWERVTPVTTATIAGAWLATFLSSGWKPPIDSLDRLGRGVSFAWLSLLFCQGFIYLLAWG